MTLAIVGYADAWSVRPGDSIKVMVSCETGATRYRAEIVRLVCGDDSAKGPGYKERPVAHPANGDYPGRRQPIHAGSYVRVPPDATLQALASFRLQALIWPTAPGRGAQTLLGRWDDDRRAGYALILDAAGALALRLGDGSGRMQTVSTGAPLDARAWYAVSARYDQETKAVEVRQTPLRRRAHDMSAAAVEAVADIAPAPPPETPFLMAAHVRHRDGGRLVTGGHYNGKMEAPRLAGRAGEGELAAAAAWDFAREIPSDDIVDISGQGRDGVAVNLPARAMTGHLWNGEVHRWTEKPEHYAAIHFHDDDLYDAGWEPDFEVSIPSDMKSGVYAVKLACGAPREDGGHEAFVPFFVRPPKGKATAPVAFLASTATYMAYANSHHGWDDPLAEITYGSLLEFGPTELFLNARREFGVSTYDVHTDGSGSCYSSRLRPILNTRPRHKLWNFNADLHVIDWLEAIGQPCDIITDEELHRAGAAALKPYRAVLTGTHPEYHSRQMIQGIEDYLQGGGRLMYLGGNGFYWRIAFHPELPGVIEVRRGENGTRTWIADAGEYYLSFTGEMSGLWRANGWSSHKLVGISFGSEGFDVSSYYRRQPDSFDPRAAFIFEGIGADERIGDFGAVGGGAAGLELDIVDPRLGTPPHALVLAASENHSNVYLMTPEEIISTYPGLDGIEDPRVRADMVFFETPNGGAVFSTGSIAWAGSLGHNGYDNNVARITGNVLRRFLDPAPLEGEPGPEK
ncbi:MAG: N,N-dimethylformamidase beta subunit family domain-containing protein [Dongiaceae bacterium]